MTTSPIVERVRALVAPICADLGLDLYDVEFGGGQLTVTLDALPGAAGTSPAPPATLGDIADESPDDDLLDEDDSPDEDDSSDEDGDGEGDEAEGDEAEVDDLAAEHEDRSAEDGGADGEDARRGPGITLDRLALATRLISRELDHADPIPGRYTLEVTSPGLERTLRTAAHFHRAVGSEVAVRLRDVTNDERRVHGVLTAAGDDGFTVERPDGSTRRVTYAQVDRARTVFTWGPAPKPARPAKGTSKGAGTGGPARHARPRTQPITTPTAATDTTEAPAP